MPTYLFGIELGSPYPFQATINIKPRMTNLVYRRAAGKYRMKYKKSNRLVIVILLSQRISVYCIVYNRILTQIIWNLNRSYERNVIQILTIALFVVDPF